MDSSVQEFRIVAFAACKAGCLDLDWEDGVVASSGDPARNEPARFAIADGATTAPQARPWVEMLLGSFLSSNECPELNPAPLRHWFDQMQRRWRGKAPSGSVVAGPVNSFATLLGCQIENRHGVWWWRAAALGDCVLFHVRGDQLRTSFPLEDPAEFSDTPKLVHTSPDRLDHMVDGLCFREDMLLPGDTLFAATDAFAHWILTCLPVAGDALWSLLRGLDHPSDFKRLVDCLRESMELEDDDVTLLRVDACAWPAELLAVCRG